MTTKISKRIPKGQIEWWIDRYTTVATTNHEIEIEFMRLTAGKDWTEKERLQAIAYAIKCHTKGQSLFKKVVTGNL